MGIIRIAKRTMSVAHAAVIDILTLLQVDTTVMVGIFIFLTTQGFVKLNGRLDPQHGLAFLQCHHG
jgi:hypothetical protein